MVIRLFFFTSLDLQHAMSCQWSSGILGIPDNGWLLILKHQSNHYYFEDQLQSILFMVVTAE